jgi:hypothetical protein
VNTRIWIVDVGTADWLNSMVSANATPITIASAASVSRPFVSP